VLLQAFSSPFYINPPSLLLSQNIPKKSVDKEFSNAIVGLAKTGGPFLLRSHPLFLRPIIFFFHFSFCPASDFSLTVSEAGQFFCNRSSFLFSSFLIRIEKIDSIIRAR